MRLVGESECAKFHVVLESDLRSFPANGPIILADDVIGQVDWKSPDGVVMSRTLGKHSIRLLPINNDSRAILYGRL